MSKPILASLRKTKLFLLLLAACLLLSSCRYWELYRFSEQFCSFDDYISIIETQGDPLDKLGTQIVFSTPVLKRELLLRYLGASPLVNLGDMIKLSAVAQGRAHPPSDHFTIANKNPSHAQFFSFDLSYHLLSKQPLLAQGALDTKLSKVFTPELLRSIMSSFCTDDYELSRQQVDLKFKLEQVKRADLPSYDRIKEIFGLETLANPNLAGSQKSSLDYHFDFLASPPKQDPALDFQNKDIHFKFDFDSENILRSIHIVYYRYDYYLDFTLAEGRLVVTRSK